MFAKATGSLNSSKTRPLTFVWENTEIMPNKKKEISRFFFKYIIFLGIKSIKKLHQQSC
jgi:hypothetical protein